MKNMIRKAVLGFPWMFAPVLVLTSMLPSSIHCQSATTANGYKKVEVQTIPPRIEDMATPDGIVKAFYEVNQNWE